MAPKRSNASPSPSPAKLKKKKQQPQPSPPPPPPPPAVESRETAQEEARGADPLPPLPWRSPRKKHQLQPPPGPLAVVEGVPLLPQPQPRRSARTPCKKKLEFDLNQTPQKCMEKGNPSSVPEAAESGVEAASVSWPPATLELLLREFGQLEPSPEPPEREGLEGHNDNQDLHNVRSPSEPEKDTQPLPDQSECDDPCDAEPILRPRGVVRKIRVRNAETVHVLNKALNNDSNGASANDKLEKPLTEAFSVLDGVVHRAAAKEKFVENLEVRKVRHKANAKRQSRKSSKATSEVVEQSTEINCESAAALGDGVGTRGDVREVSVENAEIVQTSPMKEAGNSESAPVQPPESGTAKNKRRRGSASQPSTFALDEECAPPEVQTRAKKKKMMFVSPESTLPNSSSDVDAKRLPFLANLVDKIKSKQPDLHQRYKRALGFLHGSKAENLESRVRKLHDDRFSLCTSWIGKSHKLLRNVRNPS